MFAHLPKDVLLIICNMVEWIGLNQSVLFYIVLIGNKCTKPAAITAIKRLTLRLSSGRKSTWKWIYRLPLLKRMRCNICAVKNASVCNTTDHPWIRLIRGDNFAGPVAMPFAMGFCYDCAANQLGDDLRMVNVETLSDRNGGLAQKHGLCYYILDKSSECYSARHLATVVASIKEALNSARKQLEECPPHHTRKKAKLTHNVNQLRGRLGC
jgi:hypothetical protein